MLLFKLVFFFLPLSPSGDKSILITLSSRFFFWLTLCCVGEDNIYFYCNNIGILFLMEKEKRERNESLYGRASSFANDPNGKNM